MGRAQEAAASQIVRGEVNPHSADEEIVAELCRREGINLNVYYRWSKEFLEASKKRLAGDTAREATTDEVNKLCAESTAIKESLAEVMMENRLRKKVCSGMGRTIYEIFGLGEVRDHSVGRTMEKPELSPRELATKYTDEQSYFVSESTVYRFLKVQDLIASLA